MTVRNCDTNCRVGTAHQFSRTGDFGGQCPPYFLYIEIKPLITKSRHSLRCRFPIFGRPTWSGSANAGTPPKTASSDNCDLNWFASADLRLPASYTSTLLVAALVATFSPTWIACWVASVVVSIIHPSRWRIQNLHVRNHDRCRTSTWRCLS